MVGGRLPDYLGDEALESVRSTGDGEKVIIGNLLWIRRILRLNTIEDF